MLLGNDYKPLQFSTEIHSFTNKALQAEILTLCSYAQRQWHNEQAVHILCCHLPSLASSPQETRALASELSGVTEHPDPGRPEENPLKCAKSEID